MIYAEMVMYQNDESRYAKALGYMQEIIKDKQDYDLNPDYANIFLESGEWTKESIFEIGYMDDGAVRAGAVESSMRAEPSIHASSLHATTRRATEWTMDGDLSL